MVAAATTSAKQVALLLHVPLLAIGIILIAASIAAGLFLMRRDKATYQIIRKD